MTITLPFICTRCARFQGIDPEFVAGQCTAFGEIAIPDEMIKGKDNHTTPHDGDNGMMFLSWDDAPDPDKDPDGYQFAIMNPAPPSDPPEHLKNPIRPSFLRLGDEL